MNPASSAALFSSATDEWATPADLVDSLRADFPFELDVCATLENAKASRYFTKADNGLAQEWAVRPGSFWWMNPPYGREIKHWVARAAWSASRGWPGVSLLPARTDTKWFQSFVYPVLRERPSDVEFLAGRLKFGGAKHGAPFPSVLVVFRPPAA